MWLLMSYHWVLHCLFLTLIFITLYCKDNHSKQLYLYLCLKNITSSSYSHFFSVSLYGNCFLCCIDKVVTKLQLKLSVYSYPYHLFPDEMNFYKNMMFNFNLPDQTMIYIWASRCIGGPQHQLATNWNLILQKLDVISRFTG